MNKNYFSMHTKNILRLGIQECIP